MFQIEISDSVFSNAKRIAAQQGYSSVQDYLEHLLTEDMHKQDVLAEFFTPEILADIDRITAKLDAGEKTYSQDEVSAHLEARKAEWKKRAS